MRVDYMKTMKIYALILPFLGIFGCSRGENIQQPSPEVSVITIKQ